MIDVPVEVKYALREGTYKKNYRFVVLNDDGTPDETIGTIDNDYLVSESVSIDERMCSGDTLKFGLCEGSSLEFQYFNKPNITGKRVQAFVDVEYGADEPYTIPMGFFDVKKCSRQASTGIIKATCYNKLQSDYLDAKANELIEDAVNNADNWQYVPETLGNLLDILLDDYAVEKEYEVMPYTCSKHLACDYSGQAAYPDICEWNIANNKKIASYRVMAVLEVTGTFSNWYIPNNTRLTFSIDKLKELVISKCPYANTEIQTSGGATIGLWKDNFYTEVADRFAPLQCVMAYQKNNSWQLPYRKSFAAEDREIYTSPYIYQVGNHYQTSLPGVYYLQYAIWITMPAYYEILNRNEDFYNTAEKRSQAYADVQDIIDELKAEIQHQFNTTPIEDFSINNIEWPDVTLRDLQTAVFETNCQFGQLSRITDLFSGVELNHSRLYPADSLYPATDLYPDGAAVSGFKSMYSKLWADEGNIHKWRYLIITYKGLNEDDQEEDFTLQRTINADGTDDYNMSDNWLFRNLIWTAADVGDYANAMVPKMQDITWFPFEMWCAGLPYLETGDEIEIPLGDESYTSYILQRQLKGIQNLQDTYINGTLDIF